MIWRLLPAMAVLFWAVMTVLLVRTVYFPGESSLAEVPPRFVFDLFLKQASRQTNTLHLQHRGEKIGHATLILQHSDESKEDTTYRLMARGLVERAQQAGVKLDLTWEVSGLIDVEGSWREAEFLAAVPAQKIHARVKWSAAGKLPEISVTQDGKPLVDTAQLSMLMALGGGLGGSKDGLGGLLAQLQSRPASADAALRLSAREGIVEMAGRERKCFIVSLPLPAEQSVRLLFAETGEIARIELPQDYVLIEPMIHGVLN